MTTHAIAAPETKTTQQESLQVREVLIVRKLRRLKQLLEMKWEEIRKEHGENYSNGMLTQRAESESASSNLPNS